MLHSPATSTNQVLELLDPTGQSAAPQVLSTHAHHRDSDSLVVGFLDNGKFNVGPLFAHLERLFPQAPSIKAGPRVKKPVTSKPTPDESLSELAQQSNLVINGVGD